MPLRRARSLTIWISTPRCRYECRPQGDPTAELDFTTENTQGVEIRAVPSFGVVIVQRAGLRPLRDIAPRSLSLHASGVGGMFGAAATPIPANAAP
jgi:hypothetical protein